MNKIESIVYNQIKNNPVLKSKIVDFYQSALSLIPQKPLETNCPFIERKGFFYGFHDKSPFSSDGNLLLAHKVISDYRELRADDEIEVGYFGGENWLNYICLDRTRGWNWQMGSMLQWKGLSNTEVVYNIWDDGAHKARIKDITTNKIVKDLPWAVSHVSPDGKHACSYNFHRAEKAMPGYGLKVDKPQLNDEETDFFRIFSIDDLKVTFKISIAEIRKIQPDPSMEGSFHFFHHSLFNPSSERLFFLHRWLDINGRRWTRMFSVGLNGDDLYLFPMNEMVSHITWASNSEIFSYLRYPNDGEGYYLVKDKTGTQKRFFEDKLNSDGHPTYLKDKGLVITDTYPNRFRNQYLVLMDVQANKRIDIAKTHLPNKFKTFLQVDLHPRAHPFQNIICVDSAHSGEHSLMTFEYSNYMK
jgi:hypothetical protein